jgi:hypothetical protein
MQFERGQGKKDMNIGRCSRVEGFGVVKSGKNEKESVCLCEGERERERERVCVCVRKRERECVKSVCERERERERKSVDSSSTCDHWTCSEFFFWPVRLKK